MLHIDKYGFKIKLPTRAKDKRGITVAIIDFITLNLKISNMSIKNDI